jgi:hypothetical protein
VREAMMTWNYSNSECIAITLVIATVVIHRHKDGKVLVSVTSDKLFHTAAAPPSLGF